MACASGPHCRADMTLPPTEPMPLRPRRAWLAALLACSAAPRHSAAADAPDEQPVIERLEVGGASIELQFTPDFNAAQRALARQWVQRSADAAVRYFGRFPVPQLELLLQG